jgi:hypothetical protein
MHRFPKTLSCVAFSIAMLGCKSSGAPTDDGLCARDVEPLSASVHRGMSLAHNYQHAGARGYGSPTSDATLQELADVGVEWVSLTPFGFMRSLDEPRVHFIGDYRGGETDARMEEVLDQAKARGLRVLLKPHLWIARGEWRGNIDFARPADWQRWFDSYERWILHYADMAQRNEVAAFVIGVEFRSSQRAHQDRWRDLARKVRERYDGKLTYAANWDDAAEVSWWDAVDYIGVQFYPPVANGGVPKLASVRESLTSNLDAIETVSRRFDRPVLFTEVGYRAADDALEHPHQWPERSRAAAPNPSVQELGYRAFVSAIRNRPWVKGVYWWKWFTDPATDEEGSAGFSPRGRPAERVLRAAYGGLCRPL